MWWLMTLEKKFFVVGILGEWGWGGMGSECLSKLILFINMMEKHVKRAENPTEKLLLFTNI